MAVDIIPISPNEPLELTGERYPGTVAGEVKHEHYHRYFFALQFCDKKEVLDIGSADGYGSVLLGMVAQQVFGVDPSPEAVARASRNYHSARVSFTVGDYAAIPLSDASVDVVVSFETWEYVADREKFFCEIKRTLRPGGMLVISARNARAGKDLATGPNPSQVKELDGVDFGAILRKHFCNCRLLGQRSVIGSAIAPDSSILGDGDRHQSFRAADSDLYSVQEGIGQPTYFIAVASESALPEIRHGLLDDGPVLRNLYDLLEKRAIAIREIGQQLRASVTNRDELQLQLEAAATTRDELERQLEVAATTRDELLQKLRVSETTRDELQRQLQASETTRDELQDKLRSRESELSEVHTRLSQLSVELQSRDEELAQSRALVARIYSSASWRVTLPLRFLRQIADAIRRRSVLLAERLGVGRFLDHPVFSDGTNSETRKARLALPLETAERPDAAPPRAASTEPETEMQVLQRSGLFDEQFYCGANPDVGTGEISPLEHYLSAGGFEGRRPNRLFDSACYLSAYPDVAKAGVNPALHYFLYGALEGRDPSVEFDTSYYLEANPDVAASGINPLVHFLRFGAAEGRLPLQPETEMQVLKRSGLFDEQFYLEANPDVASGELSPLEHYLSVGGFEGRRPNRLFDSAYYLSSYPDVAKAGVNPALHYFLHGALEGRDPSAEFDTSYYLEANPDVAASGINPLVHFLRFGAAEGRLPLRPETKLQVLERSGLFDEQFYCKANPDVASGEISPLEHYLSVGGFEGRRPNWLFDSAYYLRTYPDVAKAGVNPALHYFLDGALEGRDPSAEFDTSYYLDANPDVATSEINPLVHFLRFGAQEGRFPKHDLQKLERLAAARYRQDKLDYRPLVSVLMGTYNTEPIYLEAAVRSVMAQAYSYWELQIVDNGSSNSATLITLERVAALDERIFVIRKAYHGGNSDARNYALHEARGEYVALLDDDGELTFDALYEVVLALNADRTTDVIYTDQCYVSPGSEPTHLFKPDWSPSLLRGVMYVDHLLVVRRSLALDVGGFEFTFDGIQDFEFMLRISEQTHKIRHVPKVLYRCRQIAESVVNGDKPNRGIEQLQVAAVQAHLGRLGLDGLARPSPHHSRRVIIEPVGHRPNSTFDLIVHSGAIPVSGAWAINSSLARTAHQPARMAVPAAWSGLEIVANTATDLLFDDARRRFSDAERLTQFLVESCSEFVLSMSADVAIETDGWMEQLAVVMQESGVAVACPAVLSVDGLIAHAGLIVGSDGLVTPAMRGREPQSDGYAGSLSCAREISAAWADVVLLRRSAIVSLLLPKLIYMTADFLVADLTLRATRAGLRALCVPYVRALQTARTEADRARRLDARLFQDFWSGKAVADPFYNANFVENRADYA